MTCCFACAADGDRPALEAVVARLRPRLTKMSAYYARRTGEEADDLLQEAWFGLLQALPELDTTIGSPEQFLIQRARWRMLDAVKRARPRSWQPLDEAADAIGSALHDPRLGEGAWLWEFALRLKPSQRAVLHCLLAGFTWREAGDRLGCTSANIAYHVRQIRRAYTECYGEK